jgi:hypothetical protein
MQGDNGHQLGLESFDSDVRDSMAQLFQKNPEWFKTISIEITKDCEFLKQE